MERLYLAESVAKVIEVKSILDDQWDDGVRTAESIEKLTRPTGCKKV
jgi:hypothetical protein